MEYIYIYLLQVLPAIQSASVFVAALSAVVIVPFIIMRYLADVISITDEDREVAKKIVPPLAVILVISLLCTALPNKQTMVLIGGTYYGKKVITSSTAQKVNTIINLKLDNMIKESR